MRTSLRISVVLLVIAVAVAVMAIKDSRRTHDATGTVTSALPRLVDLGADKCVPCKMMAPILEELREEFAGRFEVTFIDVWKTEGVAAQYEIQVIPTQIFFDAAGTELFRHEGFYSRQEILAKWTELGVEF